MIRLSTQAFYNSGVNSITSQQRAVLEAQQKLAAAKRILTPADDPVGAGQAALLRSETAQFTQFTLNQGFARSSLEMTEGALTSFVSAVQDVQDRLVQAGDGVLNNRDRQTLASDLVGVLQRMVGIANSSDGNGGYLFAGSRNTTTPFVMNGTAVAYQGDSMPQAVEVSQDRFQQVKLAGDDAFMKMRPGNGTFVTAPAAANTGTGIIDIGAVVNPTLVTGATYAVNFSVAGGVTSYTVMNGATTVATGTYTDPGTLTFDGIQVGLTGKPADGDTFSVAPATPTSVFQSMADAVVALQTAADTPASQAKYRSALLQLSGSMVNALGGLTQKVGEVGIRQSELDAYEEINDSRLTDFKTRVSMIEDLDMAEGATKLSQHQATYQAALQSYSTVSRLSLFNYLS